MLREIMTQSVLRTKATRRRGKERRGDTATRRGREAMFGIPPNRSHVAASPRLSLLPLVAGIRGKKIRKIFFVTG
jgi:hypothetical protein